MLIFVPVYMSFFLPIFKIFSFCWFTELYYDVLWCSFLHVYSVWGSPNLELLICNFHQVWEAFGYYFFKYFVSPTASPLQHSTYQYITLSQVVPHITDALLFSFPCFIADSFYYYACRRLIFCNY